MKKYEFNKIEPKWQKIWEKAGIYRAKGKGKKWYSLIEFPYPSGDGLHVGHVRSNTAMDIVSRKRRMEGHDVLYPIGWDAFGLPTENYAIKTGVDPAVATKRNTDNFRRQLKALGFSFDWSREINTTDPEYYKWTQWMFLKFFEKGLAYKAQQPINWCPRDKIGLANEEAVGGICDRCGGPVETRMKEQWMIKITAYADKLLEGLKDVDYISRAKVQQEHWIGKSEGLEEYWQVEGMKLKLPTFTTWPHTSYGATFLAVAPEHPCISDLVRGTKYESGAEKFIQKIKKEQIIDRLDDTKKKEGYFTGRYAINHLTGWKMPIYIANFAIMDYGTGIVKGCPAHDQRDLDFAKKYELPIHYVIDPVAGTKQKNPSHKEKVSVLVENAKGEILTINWGPKMGGRLLIGGTMEPGEDPVVTALREVAEETGYKNLTLVAVSDERMHYEYFAHSKQREFIAHTKLIYFRLKNDVRSPQALEENEKGKFAVEWITKDHARKELVDPLHRYTFDKFIEGRAYTGEGIMVNAGAFTGMATQEARKAIADFIVSRGDGKYVTNYKLRDWVFSRQRYWGEPIPLVHCDACGWVPVPEKDLPVKLPKLKNYKPRDDGQSPLASVTAWVNVKCPRCKGPAKRETDTMPNWAGSSWYFLRYIDPKNKKTFADAKKLKYWMPVDWYNGGMEHTVLHLLYSRFWNRFLYDLGLVPTAEPYKRRTSHGLILAGGGVKMSKSKGNVINPDDIVKGFGADTLRLYEMFLGPFDQAIAWDERGILGAARFLEKVWKTAEKVNKSGDHPKIEVESHKLVKKVGEDIESMSFNTAVSAMMIFINARGEEDIVPYKAWERFLLVLAPFAPHIAEELWQQLRKEGGSRKFAKVNSQRFASVHLHAWPSYDPSLIEETTATIVVQVNGKVRGTFEARADISQREAEARALELPRVKESLGGVTPKRIIYIPGKLVNIVL